MCFYNLDCKVAIENPVQSRIFELPKHTQEIQPYEFGHPYTKKTRLWLKGLPKLKPTNIIDKSEVKTFIESGTRVDIKTQTKTKTDTLQEVRRIDLNSGPV